MERNIDNVSIAFLGAAGTVTGSKHLLKTPELNVLIDCGLFQGLKSLRRKNRLPLAVDIEDIDVLILTHAHLDHTGYIPLLVKNGFKGIIYCSDPTREVARLILLDSARIQEEDAIRANMFGYTKHKPALPLYTVKDAEVCLEQFRTVEENKWQQLSDNVKFRLKRNGHILGSCFIELDCYGKIIVFSGDIGRLSSRYLFPPSVISQADFLIMESTYGNRNHPDNNEDMILAELIKKAIARQGSVIVPSFAIGRAQELLLLINELKETNQIPDVEVFLDSPMAIDATKLLLRFPEWHTVPQNEVNRVSKNVRLINESTETRSVIESSASKIVVAASGMLTGGRVLDYLKRYLPEKKNLILIAGFQAEGTRGRALKEGAHEIKIHGDFIPVKAEVDEITSLSAHADQKEMIGWLGMFTRFPQRIFLVHGEPDALDTFRVKIRETYKVEPEIPAECEEYFLFDVNVN